MLLLVIWKRDLLVVLTWTNHKQKYKKWKNIAVEERRERKRWRGSKLIPSAYRLGPFRVTNHKSFSGRRRDPHKGLGLLVLLVLLATPCHVMDGNKVKDCIATT